jgi:hypothetical protein
MSQRNAGYGKVQWVLAWRDNSRYPPAVLREIRRRIVNIKP